MEFNCDICVVRPWRKADARDIVHHANSREVWLNLRDQFPHPYTLNDAETYIGRVAGEDPPSSFAIAVDGHAAGGVGLHIGTDVESRSAEIGYWLGEQHWGRGIMTVAVNAVTEYALRDLRLLRVFGLPFAGNVASARVLEKAGYECEGILRCSAVKAGEIQDQLMYSVVRRQNLGRTAV